MDVTHASPPPVSEQPSPPSTQPPARHPPVITVFELLFAALFGALAFLLVMTPPSLGLADNGDFHRVTSNASLEPLHDPRIEDPTKAAKQYVEQYSVVKIDRPDRLNKISQIAVIGPIRLAKLCSRLTKSNVFDVRWLSLIYILLATFAMGLWVRGTRPFPTWQRALLAAAFCFVFLDLEYLVYFGSFYTEPPSLIYLLCALGCLWNLRIDVGIKRPSQFAWVIGFFGFCTLFSASKAQNVPLAFPLILVGLTVVFWMRRRLLSATAVVLALVTAGLAVQSVRQYNPALQQQNAINSVFNGVLAKSPDPAGDLKTLGLPPEWAAYANQTQFRPDSPFKGQAFDKEFYPRINPPRIVLFYVLHPARLIPLLADALDEQRASNQNQFHGKIFDQRVKYVGTFTRADDVKAKNVWEMNNAEPLPEKEKWKWPFLRAFTTWSHARAMLPGRIWFWISGGFAAILIGFLRGWRANTLRGRSAGAALIGLGLIFLLVPPTCIAGDGIWEIQKHQFLGCAVFDLIILLTLESLLSLTRCCPAARASA